MTTHNDKLRSLFLTALMVFSVFAGSVALTGGAAANHGPTEVDADAHLSSGETFWQGQQLFLQNSTDKGDTYQIRTNDDNSTGTLIDEIQLDSDDGTAVVDTSGLDGEYVVEDEDNNLVEFSGDNGVATGNVSGDNANSVSWEVATQKFDADFDSDSVTDGTTDETLTIDSNRGMYNVTVSADGDLSDDELNSTFSGDFNTTDVGDDDEITLYNVTDGEYATSFDGVDAGEYTFDFNVADTDASSSDTINVSEANKGDVMFKNDVVKDQIGDIADITVQMENSEKSTITIGSNDQHYWINGTVKDGDDDGEVTVHFNSFTAGSDASNTSKLWVSSDSDDSIMNINEGGDFTTAHGDEASNKSLLSATDYDMNVTTGEDKESVGALALQGRTTDSISVWTVPGGENFGNWDASDVAAGVGTNVTQASEIAQGDYVVFQIQASGLEGTFANTSDGDYPAAFLNNNDTAFSITHTSPGPNQEATTINASNATVVADADNDMYYVAMDTSQSMSNFSNGEDYEAEFDVNKDSELNFNDDDEAESVTASYSVVEADSALDTNEDGLILVEPSTDQTITGHSNQAPGSELQISIKSKKNTSPFLTRPTAMVQPDGSLSASADFSDADAGTNMSFTLGDNDPIDGMVVEQISTPTPTEEPTEATEEPTEATEEPTEETAMPTEEPTEVSTTEGSGPGFGVIAALGALIAAAFLAVRRRD